MRVKIINTLKKKIQASLKVNIALDPGVLSFMPNQCASEETCESEKKTKKHHFIFFLLTDTARRASSASGTLKSLLNVHEVWGSSGAINTRSSRLCPRLCMDLIASNRGHTFGRGL